jgi:hypothetical protein
MRMTHSFPITSLIIALAITLISMALLYAFPAGVWASWPPATCLATGCFCEAANPLSPVKQAVNAWSSLAYVFPGVVILGRVRGLKRQSSGFRAEYAAIVGAAALVVGLGSAFYHASLTFTGQFFDILGMYLLSAFMLVYALERSLNWKPRQTLVTFLLVNGGLTLVQVLVPETRRYCFAILLLAGLILEYRLVFTHKITARAGWLNLGLGLFALAFGIWNLDNLGIACDPAGLLQGHAVWHVLGAAGVGCLYRYYRSENGEKIPPPFLM